MPDSSVQVFKAKLKSMIYWIKKIAGILALAVFFTILFADLSVSGSLEFFHLIVSVIKAVIAASLFWFAGFIAGDIILKGLITDIEHDEMNLLEGGMIQRLDMKKQDMVPGGDEMPFVRGKKEKRRNQK